MKNPILRVTDEWRGYNYIEVLRLFNREDFDILERGEIPEIYITSKDGRERPSCSCQYTISLKQEVIDHFVEVFDIELIGSRRGGDMFRTKSALTPVALEWHPTPANIYVNSKEFMSYRGIQKTNYKRRQERYNQIRQLVLNDWQELKEEKLLSTINALWTEFHLKIESNNAVFEEKLVDSVEHLNVGEEWLEENREGNGRQIAETLAEALSKIQTLKRVCKGLDMQLAEYDRDLVERHMTGEGSEFSDATKAKIHEIRSNAAGKIPDTRKRGFML
ncbi:MAG: hypothetical protein DRQ89_12535 [Epsilonproteobacteria bacterium]|nr:MAG: hypothetical protein DRQ89_12535 [Campylobacterota bacterium]